jgi:hypothetical protein
VPPGGAGAEGVVVFMIPSLVLVKNLCSFRVTIQTMTMVAAPSAAPVLAAPPRKLTHWA